MINYYNVLLDICMHSLTKIVFLFLICIFFFLLSKIFRNHQKTSKILIKLGFSGMLFILIFGYLMFVPLIKDLKEKEFIIVENGFIYQYGDSTEAHLIDDDGNHIRLYGGMPEIITEKNNPFEEFKYPCYAVYSKHAGVLVDFKLKEGNTRDTSLCQ